MWRRAIMTVGGLGYLRPAPGTWGSLPPCVLAGLFVLFDGPYWVLQVLLGLTIVGSSGLCIRLGRWAERTYHGKDPGVVVIDETAGMALTLLLVPLHGSGSASGVLFGLGVISAAFVLFRILDIVKVAPANLVQQFPAGWGILLDDLVVAVYGNVVLQVFLRFGLPKLAGN